MNKQHLVLIGGGGHCKSCIDVIHATGKFEIKAILDVQEKVGQTIYGYKIVGTDNELEKWVNKHTFLITIGQIKQSTLRKKIYDRLMNLDARLAIVISPFSIVSSSANIGHGTIIMHQASINADAVIGNNCIVNTASNIEHDCTVGDHVHVSTGSMINGGCKIGNETFIGSNSVVVNGVEIGANIVIGAGAIVNRNLIQAGVYAGNPCKKIENK